MNKVTYAEALMGMGSYEIKQKGIIEIENQENPKDNARFSVPQSSDIRTSQPERPTTPSSNAIASVKLTRPH